MRMDRARDKGLRRFLLQWVRRLNVDGQGVRSAVRDFFAVKYSQINGGNTWSDLHS